MARPDAILQAYKAMPGAAAITPSPQGGSSYFGQYSPLVQQLDQSYGYTRAYGPGFLPRSPRTFTEGAFGPFSPILPVPVDQPADGADMPDARLYQFQVGWNLPVGQPGAEGIKLADFATLKTLADLYSVARACIEIRKNELAGLDWDIIPTKDAAKNYYGSDRAMRDFGARRGQAIKFFRKPDPDYNSFRTFLSALLEEVFVFDALSLLIRPKRGKGLKRGILGTDLDCLELISGPTMRPLVGMHGEVPRPPNPAYQQYLYGVPRSDYMTMITERDIEEGGLTDAEINSWSTDQFLYLPMVPRRWTPYGFPPVERALIPIMSGLQKQAFQLDYFKEGTIPAVYVSPGDVNMTPNQIRELQDALNAFAGDPAWHHKVIVLPPGSKVDPQKAVDVADQFDDVVMTQVCMAFDVNPMELGILPKVAATQSPSQIKQMAQSAGSVHERLSTKPTLQFLADIFDSILQNVLHQYDMKFTFEGLTEDAEQGLLTDLLVQQVQSGLRSVDEARDALELQPWGLPATSGPVVFTAAGPIPFGAAPVGPQAQSQAGAQAATRKPPTAGPAPLQQAGRQGGQANLTPGHAAASAANASRSSRATSVSAPATGSVSSQKMSVAAVESELSMLVRHLNKGRRISTWRAVNIPSHAMAVISEDLAKGLSPEQCADIAKTILLNGSEYEWLPKEEARQDAPWETISQRFSKQIEKAFASSITDITALIQQWWSGQVMMTRQALVDQIREILYAYLGPVLQELWAESWRENDETAGGYFEAWAASHGRDALEQIAGSRLRKINTAISAAVRSGRGPSQVTDQLAALLDAGNRSQMIAVTEVGRAASAAAVSRYRAQNVSHKEWLTANDGRVCASCMSAQDEGPLPLDTLFKNGLLGPPAHPNCRCTLQPAISQGIRLKSDQQGIHGVEHDIECERGHTHHGEYGAAGVLVRHKGDDGKQRFLLQKRSPWEDDPGTWSLPGGALLAGETPEQGAFREAQEEMGPFPPSVTPHHHVVDDHGGWAFTTIVCDVPEIFHPDVSSGETPEESAGYGWFTKDEISNLPLHPGFKEAWEAVIRTRKNTELGKCVMRRVNLDGQEFWESPDPCPCKDYPVAAGGGGPEFMPHDVNNIQHGRASGSRGGGTSGHFDDGGVVNPRPGHPLAGDDGMAPPYERGVPPSKGPIPQGFQGGFWPQGGHGTGQAGILQPGGPTGIPPSRPGPREEAKKQAREILSTITFGKCLTCGCKRPCDDHDDPRHITRHDLQEAAEAAGISPGQAAANLMDEVREESIDKRYVTEAMVRVMAQLSENFPDQALEWVKDADWSGPLQVPLAKIDFHDVETWAAYHEPDRVEHFRKIIKDGEELNPPVMIKVPGHKHYRVVDGHHRVLAYLKLNRPVTAWVGKVSFGMEHPALETHSSQYHSGESSQND